MLGQPRAETRRVRFELGELAQGSKVVGVRRDCPVAPTVQGVGTGVESSVADPGPHHGQHRSGGRTSALPIADAAAQGVLKNNVIVGSVNANKRHWYKASEALARADRSWLAQLITRRERPADFTKALARTPEDIKVVVQFAEA